MSEFPAKLQLVQNRMRPLSSLIWINVAFSLSASIFSALVTVHVFMTSYSQLPISQSQSLSQTINISK